MESVDLQRPSWQRGPCPTWCSRDHQEDDHPEDRLHQSAGTVIPAMVVEDPLATPPRMRQTELVVLAVQHHEHDTPWIRVEATEDGSPRLALAAATMHSLVPILHTLASEVAASA